MTDPAGDRLKGYVLAKMAERGIPSVSELARLSHVSRDTFQQWWIGRPPQGSTAELVARVLGVTYADLIAVREGIEPEPAVPAAYLERVDRLIGLIERLLTPDDLDAMDDEARAQARIRPTPPGPGKRGPSRRSRPRAIEAGRD